MGVGVSVGTLAEVAVERVNNRILLLLVGTFTGPLADAGSAGIGEHFTANLFEYVEESVALRREANLLGSRSDTVLRGNLEAFGLGLTRNRGRASHVFVR